VNDSVKEPTGDSLSVVLAGGGTAGHVEPAMAVADALVALDPQVRITALGTPRGLETKLVPERGYALELITPVPLPRKPSGDLARLPLRVFRAVRQTRAVLNKVEADVVIGFGGYVSLPAYLAARGTPRRGRQVPVVIHEANASAGLANRVGGSESRPAARRSGRRAGPGGHYLAGPSGIAVGGARALRVCR
jgi:UDP-N-acetylglucosamine--N-acetylmuramyl-(pentapeptide) pyrophosphoryl-undecaprenol N-acetylglucosamine transferase